MPGSDKVDTIIVQNSGSDAVTNARVVAPLPDGILSATWVGQGSLGANVPASGSSGNGDALNTFISLPAGGTAIFTVTNQIAADAIGQIKTDVTAVTPLGTLQTVILTTIRHTTLYPDHSSRSEAALRIWVPQQ